MDAASQQVQFNAWPLQMTKLDLDWAVWAYIFIFSASIGTAILYRLFACCTERSSKDAAFV